MSGNPSPFTPPPQHPQPPPFDATQFWGIIAATARNVAAVLLAFGVIWAGMWTYIIQPQVDHYFEAKLGILREELVEITSRLEAIQKSLPAPRAFVEVSGTGHFNNTRSYKAGETVTFLYLLRRNNDCPTTVRVQFWSERVNAIASELSYEVPDQQPSPSFGFQLFSVRVRLPDGMSQGVYAYAPILYPDLTYCPGERPVVVEPSDFFEVRP